MPLCLYPELSLPGRYVGHRMGDAPEAGDGGLKEGK